MAVHRGPRGGSGKTWGSGPPHQLIQALPAQPQLDRAATDAVITLAVSAQVGKVDVLANCELTARNLSNGGTRDIASTNNEFE